MVWGQRRLALVITSVLTALLTMFLVSCSPGTTETNEANDTERTVGGLQIYLGIVPAELVRGHDAGTTSAMHEPNRTVPDSHHVMVAIFDAATGARFPAASVTATIRPARGPTTVRSLEPMVVNGALTFGNYFALPSDGSRTVIEVEVARPGTSAVTARFAYRHSL